MSAAACKLPKLSPAGATLALAALVALVALAALVALVALAAWQQMGGTWFVEWSNCSNLHRHTPDAA